MTREQYEKALMVVAAQITDAESKLCDIANDNAFNDEEFLKDTHALDDVALHLHKALANLRKAYKSYND